MRKGGAAISEPATEVERGLSELTAWAAGLSFEDIPGEVLRRAALIIADDLAAIVAARDEPEVACLQRQLLEQISSRQATVFRGGRPRADKYSAAVANAAACDWTELDEGYRKATCHAGLYSLPALLAEAEAEGAGAREVLRAAVVAYEVTTRFSRVWKFPVLDLHPHAIFAAVGAAAAVSALRNLPGEVFLDALASASTLVAVGPFDHAVQGALIRNLWPAAGAWNGMRSVDWAQCGVTALARTPNDVYARTFGAEVHPGEFTAGLGREWAVSHGYHKMFACCQYSHSAVESALALRAAMKPDQTSRRIRRILVETHPLGLKLDNYDPPTTLAAKFSLPFIVAAALALGEAGAPAFSAARLGDEEIARLRNKVELRLREPQEPWPHDRAARLTVEFEDGATLSRECLSAAGGPDRPFTERQILDKVSLLTRDVYPRLAEEAERLIGLDPTLLDLRWEELVTLMVIKDGT
ncbi:MAG: MmgE/PrpD family protein [Thermodesulfobacteriota bacterium]